MNNRLQTIYVSKKHKFAVQLENGVNLTLYGEGKCHSPHLLLSSDGSEKIILYPLNTLEDNYSFTAHHECKKSEIASLTMIQVETFLCIAIAEHKETKRLSVQVFELLDRDKYKAPELLPIEIWRIAIQSQKYWDRLN